MLAIVLSMLVFNATQDEIKSKFLDEFVDFKLSLTVEPNIAPIDDILYVHYENIDEHMEQSRFAPDVEMAFDYT